MGNVVSPVLGEDEDVVKVNEDVLVKHVPKYVIYQGLKHGWGVGQTERHD